MGLFSKKKASAAEEAVGAELLAVLPQDRKPWYKTPHLVQLYVILLVPLVSSATVGFDGAVMNGLQSVSQWRKYFGDPASGTLGILNAIYPIGKLVGILPTTYISDRYGRRCPLIIGFTLCIIGAALQGASQNFAMFITARLLLGFATAFLAQPSPILITELAHPLHRGKITALYNTSFYLGGIIAAWSTYGTFPLKSTWSWRIPSLLQGALPVIQLLFVYFVPESPRWLIARGRQEQARKILVKFHAGGDESSPLIAYEMSEIEQNIRLESAVLSEMSYLDLVRTAPNRKRTLIAFIVGIGAQWNGISIVSYYLRLVLNTIGIRETKDQTFINGMLNIFNWLTAIFAGALMVDRVGRRRLFLISVAGMLCSYIAWTVLTSYFTRTLDEGAGRAVVAFIFICYFFYNIAWSPLLQAYPVEIFPYTLRSRGLSVSMASTFVGLIISQFVNPIAMKAIGWKYYIVFCSILAFLFVVIWFLFPETKGRTLEQIAEIFDGPKQGARAEDVKRVDGTSEDEADVMREKNASTHVEKIL